MNVKLSFEIKEKIELLLLEYLNENNYLDFEIYNYLSQKIFYKKGRANESI